MGIASARGLRSGSCVLPYYVVLSMDVSVRELRNHTRRVIAVVERGEPVVLTVHGRPVADIVPRRSGSERRRSDVLLADLAAIAALADDLGVNSDPADFETGLTADK